jgi:hypothetical protein
MNSHRIASEMKTSERPKLLHAARFASQFSQSSCENCSIRLACYEAEQGESRHCRPRWIEALMDEAFQPMLMP